jgi:hypothetical protein
MTGADNHNPRELTDGQLDAVLAAADQELLTYIRASADVNTPLHAIMTAGTGMATGLAGCMIAVRSQARRVGLDFDLNRDLAAAMVEAINRARDISTEHPPTRILDLARALACARGRALDVISVITQAAALNRAIIRAEADPGRAADLAQQYQTALNSALDSADALDQVAQSLGGLSADLRGMSGWFMQSLTQDLIHAIAPRTSREYVSIHVALDRAKALARALALALAPTLDQVPVDASGADLTDADVEHLDVLNGIIWNDQTIWSPRIFHQVQARSRTIRPGTYQVTSGNEIEDSCFVNV